MSELTLTKIRLGDNEDGTPHFYYQHPDPLNAHVVITSKHQTGIVRALDGTEYDTSERIIAVKSLRHAIEVANALGQHFAQHGHPDHLPGDPFDHIDLDYPGDASMSLLGTLGGNGCLSGGLAAVMTFGSLHTASPGASPATGANEYAGVTRQAETWNAPSGNNMSNNAAMSFTTSGASAVTHLGYGNTLSTAYTAANFALGLPLGSSVTAVSITVASGAATVAAS